MLPADLLNETATIQRPSASSDGAGGWAETLTLIGDVPARFRPTTLNADDATPGESAQARIRGVLYTHTSADIQRGDVVTVRSQTLEVIAVREPSVTGHHYEIDCREFQRSTH